MDLERLQGDLRRLTEIVGGWDASKEIDALERDLVLEKLRGLYEAVRFGMPVAAPAEPAVGEASAPIDLGEVLSLDPLSDLPAPDADALPEVQPPFVEVLSTVSEPEMVSVLEAAAEQTAEQSTSQAGSDAATPDADKPDGCEQTRPSGPETAAPAPEPDGKTASEFLAAASAETPSPEPLAAAAAETVAPAPAAEPAPEDSESPAVEAFISASVAESTHETAPSDPDANPDQPHEKSAAQTLFGVEEPASRHRHKQRVIMSLYGSDTPEHTPVTPTREAAPAEPVTKPVPAHKPVHPVHATTETPAETPAPATTLSDAAAAGAVLGEVINANVHTLADTIAPPHDIASELRRSEPVTDLHRAIGINDKFLMIRDLFGGDGEAFERAIEALNGFDNLDDCMIYVAENYAWNANSDGAKLLMELLERKFA